MYKAFGQLNKFKVFETDMTVGPTMCKFMINSMIT